jgi:DMSO/TMAO reductase YedYZ molybdopterin-dependent catalytic subunit
MDNGRVGNIDKGRGGNMDNGRDGNTEKGRNTEKGSDGNMEKKKLQKQDKENKKKKQKPARASLHVCFEGRELLPGPSGASPTPYGTSIPLSVALDESCDVLIAYMQNGRLLEPDHGFPARVIIPGYIGGRMVKWLTRITVTSRESDNHYHYKDNRVLPSHVDADKANAEGKQEKLSLCFVSMPLCSIRLSPLLCSSPHVYVAWPEKEHLPHVGNSERRGLFGFPLA